MTLRFFLTSICSISVSLNCYGESSLKSAIEQKHDVIDSYIMSAIDNKYFPGAQLIIGNKNEIVYSRNYGYHDYSKSKAVESDDIYDVASCTKIMSATVAVMKLIDGGKLMLTTKIKDVLGEYKNDGVGNITLAELLKHTSGLRSGVSVTRELVEPANSAPLFTVLPDSLHSFKIAARLYANKEIKYRDNYVSTTQKDGYYQIGKNVFVADSFKLKIDSMVISAFNRNNRGRYRYSDLNFYFISKIIERVSGKKLNELSDELYGEMGVLDIGFLPMSWKSEKRIVPTEYDYLLRRDTVKGFVHDEFAATLGGVCGNAGLFSNAESMAKICQLFMNYGTIEGKEILNAETVKKFTSTQLSGRAYRGYGFDKQPPTSPSYSTVSYGHTGFTGTYFWIDPSKDVFVVLLTNRVNPSRLDLKMNTEYRTKLWELITK